MPCQPFLLKLVLNGDFQSIANETVENKDTNERLSIQKRMVPKSGFAGYPRRTEIILKRKLSA